MTNETTASERERFEAAMAAKGYHTPPSLYRDGTYRDTCYSAGWDAWQARAALPAPADQTRSQKMRAAGFTRRPTWKSLPKDGDDEGSPMTPSQEAREYSPLPKPDIKPFQGHERGAYTPGRMRNILRSYVDADRKARQQDATAAARDVLAERARQIDREGWRPERDDTYTRSELSAVACAYILASRGFNRSAIRDFIWPESWTFSWFKPTNERRDLVKAGALILAEIERLDRAAIAKGERHE